VADLPAPQRKRAEARQRRRSQADAEQDEPEDSAAESGTEPRNSVKQAAKVAAAVGAAGAAAAAAKALSSHHEDGDEEPNGSEAEEPEAESSEPEQQQPPEEPEQQEEEPDEQPVAGAGPSDARRVIDRAREQLGDLLERPVESVSSLERTHDGWVAQLEVVELKRIPESTDVLGSYEMELDDDLNLRRYQQVRRYSRSQARGDGA
jgi:hypothetical protein